MEKDPAKDRIEFEQRLNSIFDWYTPEFSKKANKAFVENDIVEKTNLLSEMNECQEKIDMYLKQWDAAKTEEEKRRVVGSVKT